MMSFIEDIFYGCKKYGDLEYEQFKKYFLANSLKEEREGILINIKRLMKTKLVTNDGLRKALKSYGGHLDNGMWIEDFVVFAHKFSSSLSEITQTALETMKGDFENEYYAGE